jgi:hypothetical protein
MSGQRWKLCLMALAAALVCATASSAQAQSQTSSTTTTTTPAPAPAPSSSTTVVTPAPPAPAQQPVVVEPAAPAAPVKQKQVVTETHSENYMVTVAKSVFFGAVAGALVGTAVYFIDHENHPRNIAYWGAGGALVGGAVGLVQIAVNENRTEQAVSSMEQKRAKERGVAFVPKVIHSSLGWPARSKSCCMTHTGVSLSPVPVIISSGRGAISAM